MFKPTTHSTVRQCAGIGLLVFSFAGLPAQAAKEDGCSGGAFTIITSRGSIAGNQNSTLSKDSLGATFAAHYFLP